MAETTPTESELCLPNGLPIAATGVADDDRGRVAERHRCQRVVGGIDADDADVAEQVPADDRRRHALAVAELDVELRGARTHVRRAVGDVRDHVRVREDRAVAVDDEARALRLRRRRRDPRRA